MVSQLDDQLYENRYNVENGFFGSYFLYNFNQTPPGTINLAAFALINATS